MFFSVTSLFLMDLSFAMSKSRTITLSNDIIGIVGQFGRRRRRRVK
jgi:hypothetical protein